jgi:hypothetical protein
MIGAWSMNVGGKIYGPFTSDRMREFATEGRLAPHSLIAREGTEDWHEARDEPEFVEIFGQPQMEAAAPAMQVAVETPVTMPVQTPVTLTAPPAKADVPDGANAHFAIVIDRKSRSTGNLEDAIASLGPAYALMPNIWILSTDQSVNAVRNRLVQELGKLDSLFVIDASRGKAAWFNFGPEVDVRIRRVWKKAS